MYEGEQCETKLESGSSLTAILYLFIILLFIAGVLILMKRETYQKEIREFRAQYFAAGEATD
jgi:hypothetical protein